jgi:hypothetical protein
MVHKHKRNECKKQHPLKADFIKCITESKQHKALKAWSQYAKPSINTALVSTVTGLSLAERSKQKDFKWLDTLRPAVCAVVKSVAQWGHLFPPSQQKQIMATIFLIKGVTCDK